MWYLYGALRACHALGLGCVGHPAALRDSLSPGQIRWRVLLGVAGHPIAMECRARHSPSTRDHALCHTGRHRTAALLPGRFAQQRIESEGGRVLPGLPAAVHRPDGPCAAEVPTAHWHPLCRKHVVVGGSIHGGRSDTTVFPEVHGPSMAGGGMWSTVRRFWSALGARTSV